MPGPALVTWRGGGHHHRSAVSGWSGITCSRSHADRHLLTLLHAQAGISGEGQVGQMVLAARSDGPDGGQGEVRAASARAIVTKGTANQGLGPYPRTMPRTSKRQSPWTLVFLKR